METKEWIGIFLFLVLVFVASRYDWGPFFRTLKGITVAILLISAIATGIYTYSYAHAVPEDPGIQKQALVTMGFPSDTRVPEIRGDWFILIKQGICLTITQKKSTECQFSTLNSQAEKMTEALVRDDLVAFQGEFAATIRMYGEFQTKKAESEAAEKIKRAKEILPVNGVVITLMAIVNVIVAILGVFVSVTIEGFVKTKITAAFLWITAIFFLVLLIFIPIEAHETAKSLFASGQIVGAITVGSTLAGVGVILLGREIHPNNPAVKWAVKVLFAAIGAIIGIGADTFLQVYIVTNAVAQANGAITMTEALVAYLLGVLAWRGIGSIFGPFVYMAQAATIEEGRQGP